MYLFQDWSPHSIEIALVDGDHQSDSGSDHPGDVGKQELYRRQMIGFEPTDSPPLRTNVQTPGSSRPTLPQMPVLTPQRKASKTKSDKSYSSVTEQDVHNQMFQFLQAQTTKSDTNINTPNLTPHQQRVKAFTEYAYELLVDVTPGAFKYCRQELLTVIDKYQGVNPVFQTQYSFRPREPPSASLGAPPRGEAETSVDPYFGPQLVQPQLFQQQQQQQLAEEQQFEEQLLQSQQSQVIQGPQQFLQQSQQQTHPFLQPVLPERATLKANDSQEDLFAASQESIIKEQVYSVHVDTPDIMCFKPLATSTQVSAPKTHTQTHSEILEVSDGKVYRQMCTAVEKPIPPGNNYENISGNDMETSEDETQSQSILKLHNTAHKTL